MYHSTVITGIWITIIAIYVEIFTGQKFHQASYIVLQKEYILADAIIILYKGYHILYEIELISSMRAGGENFLLGTEFFLLSYLIYL